MDPVCRIQSGDCVDFSIPDAAWGIENYRVDGKERKTVMPCDPIYDTGHCLAGPVYIEGAERGDADERPHDRGAPAEHAADLGEHQVAHDERAAEYDACFGI